MGILILKVDSFPLFLWTSASFLVSSKHNHGIHFNGTLPGSSAAKVKETDATVKSGSGKAKPDACHGINPLVTITKQWKKKIDV